MPDTTPVRPGHLYGIGLGPGDAGLITLRGAEIIRHADVVAYHAGTHGRSTARRIAASLLDERTQPAIEELLQYPVTTGSPADYAEQMASFYADASWRLAVHLRAGRSVAVLSLGDPMLYSSYQHLHRALEGEFPAHIVPGVASINAAAAEIGQPLAEATEILTVLPATAPRQRLIEAAKAADCLVIMKLGGHVEEIRSVLAETGKLEHAYVIQRASMPEGSHQRLADVNAEDVPYFSVAVVPSQAGPHSQAGILSATTTEHSSIGEVVVVGLGPGAHRWTTPEVTAELAAATDLVGYSTYINRVPTRPGQQRHLSDNRVEAERATMALDLASRGKRVAVVSSGDPGVFAMAAAVLETADDPAWRHVPVRVVPGMTAAQAVASRVGAPLGHDFAMLSLSDRLKPWDVVAQRLRAIAGADMAFAVYNPASKSRRWQIKELRAIALEFRKPSTPVIVARAVGSDQESVTITTLAEFDPDVVDMRTMVIVGASSTKSYRAAGGTRVYTARHYAEGGTSGTGDILR